MQKGTLPSDTIINPKAYGVNVSQCMTVATQDQDVVTFYKVVSEDLEEEYINKQ